MLRIEPLARLSPRTSHRGAAAPLTHPVGLPSSLKVKGIASGGLTATALSPFAAGELQGLQYAYHAGDCLPVREKVNGGLTWGMAPCGNPPPSGRVLAVEPSRIKIGTLKGTPDFFLDGSAAEREHGLK